MTDKERLERIKQDDLLRIINDISLYGTEEIRMELIIEDIEWLVKQAERVEELEYAVRKIDVVIDHHRLIKRKEADELADCIVGIISDLEEKVGEIT